MTNPLRFGYVNHADAAALRTPGVLSIASLPLSHLKTDDIRQIWRSESTNSSQSIVADLASVQKIGVVALINSNVFSPSTFDVRVSLSDPDALDNIPYAAFNIPGIPDQFYNTFVHFIEPQVEGRYVRIAQDNLIAAPEAGRLVISPSWAPTRDMRAGFEVLARDPSNRSESSSGNEFVDVKPRRRGYRFTILALTELEAQEEVDRLNQLSGIGRDILVCRDRNSDNIGRDTIWGLLAEPVSQIKTRSGYEIQVEVWART